MVDFFSPLLDYIAESNGFTEGEAQTALAAAIAGRLGGADLSSLANRLLAVNSAGTAIEGSPSFTDRAIATARKHSQGPQTTSL